MKLKKNYMVLMKMVKFVMRIIQHLIVNMITILKQKKNMRL